MTENTAPEATATPEVKPAKTAKVKDQKNGVSRPKNPEVGVGRIWAIADEISSKKGKPAERAEVSEVAEAEGMNPSTVSTQYARWRQYHSLSKQKNRAQGTPNLGD